jgi:cytochrome P450
MTGTCPVYQRFDPLGGDYLADPYPTLAVVRAEAAAFYAPSVDMWVVTRHADIDAIFKETTTNLTGNTLLRLLGDRAAWDELCAGPQAIPGAIEEVLRYDTSVITWRRVTTRPAVIGQVEIPAGAKVLLLLGSAGRDPGRFGEPETFDIHRRDARAHLAFGKGIHYCFGAPLARMEVRIVLELLTSRVPGLR